jgi:hypothetical protein
MTFHAIAYQVGDDDSVVVLFIARGVHDRDGAAPCARSQIEQAIMLVGELAAVSRAKLIEPGGVMGEPSGAARRSARAHAPTR